MGYKKLISPEFRVTVGDYEVTDGIEVECFSSKESHMDWCRVELSPQLQGVLKFKDMDEASVELGYEDDFDSLIDGYVRCGDTDYWKEIMIKDDMMKLDRVTIKASFVDCEPQDVIRYVLACAGIEDYVLSDEHYGKGLNDFWSRLIQDDTLTDCAAYCVSYGHPDGACLFLKLQEY